MSTTLSKGIRSFADGEYYGPEWREDRLRINAWILDQWANEPPTTVGLTYGYRGGLAHSGAAYTQVASGTVLLTNGATNYVERTLAGAVSANTVGFTAARIPMAIVVCAGGVITTITDVRPLALGGDMYLLASTRGAANGVASLDGAGKVPVTQLPNSIMQYQGTWNATTNTPALADGAGNPDDAIGNVYRVTVAGTQNLGSGAITFEVGDYVILNASKIWEKADATDAVTSVAGKVGAVTLDEGDLTGIAESKLIGRGQGGGAGVGQEITLGSGLSMAGTTLSAAGGAPGAHAATHKSGGGDEILVDINVPFIIDGNGSVISTGVKGDVELPFSGTIIAWRIVADQSGSIVVDTWKDTYANFPPTVADAIWGGGKPTLASQVKNEATGLNIAVSVGDWLRFNVDSATTVLRVTLSITIRRKL